MYLFFCFIDLVILFFLSRFITRALSRLIHTKTRKIGITVKLFSFLFLPGTFLHELAHYITAHVLGVRTFEFRLMPKLEENTVRLGSVTMEKSDVLRRTLIGVAPLIFGLTVLFLSLWFIVLQPSYVLWQVVVVGFLTFQISNTMFPSKADMEGLLPFFVVIICLGLAPFFFVQGSLSSLNMFGSSTYLKTALFYFSIIVAIDIAAFAFLRILLHKR